jgi:hypothetical protein
MRAPLDRGAQYASEAYYKVIVEDGVVGLDGPARQPLRQREGGELDEDAEGRGGASHGL